MVSGGRYGSRVFKRTLPVLTAAALVVAGGIAYAALPASADTVPDPIANLNPYVGSAGGLVIDEARQHLFTTSSDGEIVVTDLIGSTTVKRIDGLKFTEQLTLSADASRLYAAVAGADEIVAIDTSTFQTVATYSLGDGVAPESLVRAGDKLWFGYVEDASVAPSPAGLGVIDLAGSDHAPTTWTQVGGVVLSQWPILAVNPANPDMLALFDPALNPNTVRLLDVSSGTPSVVASHTAHGYVSNIVFNTDGTRLIDNGGDGTAEELSTTDLSTVEEFAVGPYPGGVAVADDGTIAVGQGGDLSNVQLYKPGSTAPFRTLDLYKTGYGYNRASVVLLAFEPGSERVIALAHSTTDLQYSVQMLNDERVKEPTTVTLKAAPSPVRSTGTLTVSGTVTATENGATVPAAGVTVKITRQDPVYGTSLGGYYTTGADGTFEKTDSVAMVGAITYTASVLVDTVHAAASATTTVQSVTNTTLTLDHNNVAYAYGATVTFTAHLGSTATNRTVGIWADPAGSDQGNRLLRSATVDAKGNLTASLKLSRDTVVSAVFAGDANTQPITVKSTVLTWASAAVALSRQYKTKSSVAYFHKTTNPYVTTTINPYPKRKQYLTVDYYSGGSWHRVKSGLYALSTAGKSYVTFTSARKLNVKYRVRAAYVMGNSGDSANLSTYTAYKYFIFTK